LFHFRVPGSAQLSGLLASRVTATTRTSIRQPDGFVYGVKPEVPGLLLGQRLGQFSIRNSR
jgi:hypothetical protein